MIQAGVKGNQRLLKYSGNANNLKDENIDFQREIILNFVLSVKIDVSQRGSDN